MGKLLKAAHISLVALMLLYTSGQLGRLVVKWLDPTHDSVRFWKPGAEMVVVAIAFVALLGILACSAGVVRYPARRFLAMLQSVWLICFTWFGWTAGGPFRLQELVGINLADPAAVRIAEVVHLLVSAAVYLGIAIVVGLPIILRWHRNDGSAPSGSNAEVLQH